MRAGAVPVLLGVLGACAPAARPAVHPASSAAPALEAISTDELRRDLFTLAGDEMRGRRAGELDELRASVWLAQRAAEAGLEPAGDDGTYYQFFPVHRRRVAHRSSVTVGPSPALRLWEEAIPLNAVDARLDGEVAMVDAGAPDDLTGRVAVARLRLPARVPRRDVSFWAWRTASAGFREQLASLRERRPAALILVADSVGLQAWDTFVHFLRPGSYSLEDPAAAAAPAGPPIPVLLVRPGVAERALREGARVTIDLATESFVSPSVNVVARVPGTDATLRDQHVLFSGHQDHDGVGTPVDGDSIWNGADDNATVSVALLAIGRAFRQAPGRRSALFVWHGGEERGLLGSRLFSEAPTVPREGIVAVLNADMIGRNHPDSAALLGALPPHRNSPELVETALEANRRTAGFLVDSSWDDPAHPEGWYFRSDHLPYARAGIPALFFTSLLHPDYHTPRDDPERIDVAKMARIARWMYATGWAVANAERRPALDPAFRLER